MQRGLAYHSPAVSDGAVYQDYTTSESSFLVKLDGRTGEQLWTVELERDQYHAISAVKDGGRVYTVVAAATWWPSTTNRGPRLEAAGSAKPSRPAHERAEVACTHPSLLVLGGALAVLSRGAGDGDKLGLRRWRRCLERTERALL